MVESYSIDDPSYSLDEYQNDAVKLAVYPKETALEYCLLQLASEAGEAAGKLGKALRKGVPVDRDALIAELGDVLWYVANTAHVLGESLEAVAEKNIHKLVSRTERGVIHGDGDNR